jgi:ATP-dependent Clp protease protease subunit
VRARVGAGERTRTSTPSRGPGPKPGASANSATPAAVPAARVTWELTALCLRVLPVATSLMAMPHASEAPEILAAGADLESSGRIFQQLLKERIVFIGSAIDQVTANMVCAQLILLEAEDPEKDISLYINSPGGSVTDGLAIYDTMQYVRPDVSTICVGLAASMGQFLLCAGAPGKRFALPHSRILMHQPSGAMQGQAADIAIQAEQIIYLKRMMAERIAFHTGQTVERIEIDSDRDRWFTAEEAKEYGFIDSVIDRSAATIAAGAK